MIINIKNKSDLITIDLRLKQIRYFENYPNQVIFENNLSSNDCEGYEYLFKEDKKLFLKTIKEDLLSFSGIKVKLKDLEVLK